METVMDLQQPIYYTPSDRYLSEWINFTPSDFTPEPYTPPDSISSTHNQPRFGFGNDISALINGNSEEQKDYVLGVIIGSMIILIVAILWFFVIVCLKIAGQKKVGFFAGRLVRPVGTSTQGIGNGDEKGGVEVVMAKEGRQDGSGDEQDVDEGVPVDTYAANLKNDDPANKKFNRRVWFVRITFVLSGIFVIISGGLFYGKGAMSFRNAIDEVRRGIDLIQDAANKGIVLTESILQAESDINEEVEPNKETVSTNGEICGLDSELSTQIRTAYDEFVATVDQLTTEIEGSLENFNNDLKNVIELTEDIESSLNLADVFFYILIAISAVLIGIIFAMLGGVFVAWKGISNCFTKCIQYALIWPMFVFFLILSWIFATLFLVTSLAGSDFCVSPDLHVQNFIDRNEDLFDGLILGFIIYYVSGCKIEPPGAEDIRALASQVAVVLTGAHEFFDLLENLPLEEVARICGLTTAQAEALVKLADLGHESTHVLNRSLVGLREVLSCETFNPIYTTFVHDAFCKQGVSGLTYIFSTTLVISIFSMVMIMFRAAMYPIKEPDASNVSKSEDAIEVVQFPEHAVEDGAEEEKPIIY